MAVTHPKGRSIIWTCGKENIIREKKECKDIILKGFDYNIFEEDEGGDVRMVIYGYQYLNNITKF